VNIGRLLKLYDDEVEETEIEGFYAAERTLYCSNVAHDQILQASKTSNVLCARLMQGSSRNFIIVGLFFNNYL